MQMGSSYDETFRWAIKKTLGYEGGFVDDPVDPGGATNWGITEGIARKSGYEGSMESLPQSVAIEVYYKEYWFRNKLCDIAIYDKAIAVELFDISVNMGRSSAGKFFQRALNCLNREEKLFSNLIVDGIIGYNTIRVLTKLGKKIDKETIYKMIICLRGARYIEICEKREISEKYIRGWYRRINI